MLEGGSGSLASALGSTNSGRAWNDGPPRSAPHVGILEVCGGRGGLLCKGFVQSCAWRGRVMQRERGMGIGDGGGGVDY